ncbi:Crp/Fnr family transcriptional regulator [Paenibacillus sp. J5C_2022]|uniref:Crp/Fnr family transcriptional regulator n=1 Tax=Paenibacillus sp. J5C2022 TaxID=2977129 RepID=UPI0021CF9048|nr:Crp/Fnr family transcriptional regulator [Paenibacillus sp. J5C2022]MCU6711545.1 Crp/Fnr family transcriptional regulator [Paenibacillus sp. J5C2022]
MQDQYQASCDHQIVGAEEMQKQCISIVPIFNHLDTTEMAEIVKETHSVTHGRGHSIYRAGETSDGLYIVHKGRVKIYRLSDTGKEQLVRILGPGDFTGELSLFSESVHDAYADAMERVELCVMGRADFQKFLLKYPAISLKVLTEFSSRLAQTENQAANIALESTETRIAMYLANEVDAMNSNKITLTMSRKDLASYLGTSPETVSRRLAEFEEAGWIRQTGQREIEVMDLDALLLI